MSAYGKLRRRHQLFVDAFVRMGVATDAYREVYGQDVKRADVSAAKVMARPEVKEAVAERTEQAIARVGVRKLRVFEELARIAFSDLGDFYNPDGSLKGIHDIPAAARAALQGLEVDELFESDGEGGRVKVGRRPKIRTHSKNEALKLLGQHLHLFADRHEHSGPNGGPIPVKDESELSEVDIARRVAFLLAQGYRAATGAPDSGNPAGDSTSTQQQAGESP